MSDQPEFPTPSYLNAIRPAHFHLNPSFLGELCVGEELMRVLPKTEEARRRWLRVSGQPSKRFPLSELLAFEGHYRPTERYILQCAVLPGNNFPSNIVRDARGWAVACENTGLFNFAVLRAIQCAVHLGLDEVVARALFIPTCDGTPARVRRNAPWSIGFADGICTILASQHGGTDALYLGGRPGYHTPSFAGA